MARAAPLFHHGIRDDVSACSLEIEEQTEASEDPTEATDDPKGGLFAGQGKIVLSFVGFIALMLLIQKGLIPIPFLKPAHVVYFPIIATFVCGYIVIIFEEQTRVNKAATSLVLGVLVWAFVGTGAGHGDMDDIPPKVLQHDIHQSLVDVSEVVFFLLGALTIVEIMDMHRGFDVITNMVTATKARELLVAVSVITFCLSSVLNNLTVVIVMISLVQKVVAEENLRMRIGGIIVVVSNAAGAWTPIGDVTTTMLYIGGQVTLVPLVGNLLFPSIINVIGVVVFELLRMGGDEEFKRPNDDWEEEEAPDGQNIVFWSGIVGMMSVPIFTAKTQCPAWSGMMLVLGLVSVITSLIHDPHDKRFTLKVALTRVEVTDALFFLGILFAVGGLERIGLLKAMTVVITKYVPSEPLVALLLGFFSAIVDNVPLVAATQGMYDKTEHPPNDHLWNLITYAASTGGSLLVIGSAAGVAFMGLEKGVSFGWYLRNVTPAALAGFLVGFVAMLAQQALGLSPH